MRENISIVVVFSKNFSDLGLHHGIFMSICPVHFPSIYLRFDLQIDAKGSENKRGILRLLPIAYMKSGHRLTIF